MPCPGCGRAAWMRWVEGHGRAEQRLERHGARDVGESGEPHRAPQGERADGGQRLRPVEQRKPFLAFQADGVDCGAAQRLPAGQPLAAVDRFTLADDAEREVGQRREIAAGADGALLRDHRVHAAIQHVHERLRYQRSNPAIPERQRVGAQSHHDPRFGLRKRTAQPAGMAAHQVELQAVNGVIGNAHFTELAEAGIDAVDRDARRGGTPHHVTRGLHLADGEG